MQVVFSVFMAMKLPEIYGIFTFISLLGISPSSREFMTASLLKFLLFNQIRKMLRRLLFASVDS